MKRSCNTCEWWESPVRGDEAWGACHGAPPTASSVGLGDWPITEGSKSCRAWDLAHRLANDPAFSTARSE